MSHAAFRPDRIGNGTEKKHTGAAGEDGGLNRKSGLSREPVPQKNGKTKEEILWNR